MFGTSQTESFLISMSAGFVQLLIVLLFNRVLLKIRNRARAPKTREILRDRRITIISQISLLILITALTIFLLRSTLSTIDELLLLTLTLIFCIAVLIRELLRFWSIGINTVEPSIAADTYSKTLSASQTSFLLLGTNAHSFCTFPVF